MRSSRSLDSIAVSSQKRSHSNERAWLSSELSDRRREVPFRSVSGATSRIARDINRQAILNLIRKHQPISRADLARLSRLQRSTVSLITGQLIAEQLITEGAQGNLPRGRKPTFLHLNSARIVALGVEIRPKETTLVVADLAFNFTTRDSMPTRGTARQFVAALSQRIGMLKAAAPHLTFAGIGITLPGRVDPVSGRVVFAPSLPWQSVDLKMLLEEATGLSVEIENSANACVLAELWTGRYPESVQNMIAIVVAEGVEVGMVLNGQLVRGTGGLAGEFGHVVVQEQGPPCRCGSRGCLTVCGSNAAAIRDFTERVTKQSPGKMLEISFAAILQRAGQGELPAVQALQYMAHHLGQGIAMLVAGLAPDVIVLVGELTQGWRHIDPVIDQVMRQRLPAGFRTRILPTAPESQLPLRGAVALVLQKHFGATKIL